MTEFVGPQDPDIPPWAIDLRGTVPAPREMRDVGGIDRVVWHRLGGKGWPESAEHLITIPRLLDAWAKVTKGDRCCPYAFLIESSGKTYAIHHFRHLAKHAGIWNRTGLPVGLIGDFRKHAPAPELWRASLRLGQWLCERFERGVEDDRGRFHWGHTELPRSSKHPNKQCPGVKWDMPAFRHALENGGGHA